MTVAERRELIKQGKAPAYDAHPEVLSAPELAESRANGDASDSDESDLSELTELSNGEILEGDSSEPSEDGSGSSDRSDGHSLDSDVEIIGPVTNGAGSDGSAGETTGRVPAPLNPGMELLDELVFPVVWTWYPLPDDWRKQPFIGAESAAARSKDANSASRGTDARVGTGLQGLAPRHRQDEPRTVGDFGGRVLTGGGQTSCSRGPRWSSAPRGILLERMGTGRALISRPPVAPGDGPGPILFPARARW